jgi:LmbE family N-acetylglucosaminyl deacetylase
MFVVSPHLDDAVLGIGLQMGMEPGTCVTLLAGSPEKYPPLRNRPHDEICGLGGVADPMAARRAEDAAVMELLEWNEPVHLGLLDAQYVWPATRSMHDSRTASDALVNAWESAGEPGEIWTVAGLGHEDHRWARMVAAGVAERVGARLQVWFEPGYRTKFPDERDTVAKACVDPLRHYLLNEWEMFEKLEYIGQYESQLHGISGLALRDALLAEVTGTWSR